MRKIPPKVATRKNNPRTLSNDDGKNKAVGVEPIALFHSQVFPGAHIVKIFDQNEPARIVFIFGFAVAALLLLIFASMVDMPIRAILIAIAVSDIIFLAIAVFGNKLPDKK